MTYDQLLDLAHRAQRRGNTSAMIAGALATSATCYVMSGREALRLQREHGVEARSIVDYTPPQEVGRRKPLLVDISVLGVIGAEWSAQVDNLTRQIQAVSAERDRLKANSNAVAIENARLFAASEEARLTLAAEGGQAEGLPTQWKVTTRDAQGRPIAFHRTDRPGSCVQRRQQHGGDWSWYWSKVHPKNLIHREGWYAYARVALLAWDADDYHLDELAEEIDGLR